MVYIFSVQTLFSVFHSSKIQENTKKKIITLAIHSIYNSEVQKTTFKILIPTFTTHHLYENLITDQDVPSSNQVDGTLL